MECKRALLTGKGGRGVGLGCGGLGGGLFGWESHHVSIRWIAILLFGAQLTLLARSL